jgi:hypothetical protein
MNITNSQITEFIFSRPDLTNYMQQRYFQLFLTMFKLLNELDLEPKLIIEVLKVACTMVSAIFFSQFTLAFINDSDTKLKIDPQDIREAESLIKKWKKSTTPMRKIRPEINMRFKLAKMGLRCILTQAKEISMK